MATVLALSYVTETTHVARGTVLLCLLGAALLQIFTIPVVSLWSDRVGLRPVLISGALISILIAFPFFWLLDTGSVPLIFLALVLAIPVVHPFSPTARRPASSVSCSTRGCATPDPRSPTRSVECSPGPTPFIAAALVAWTGGTWAISLYLIAGALISIAAVTAARETYQQDTHIQRIAPVRAAGIESTGASV